MFKIFTKHLNLKKINLLKINPLSLLAVVILSVLFSFFTPPETAMADSIEVRTNIKPQTDGTFIAETEWNNGAVTYKDTMEMNGVLSKTSTEGVFSGSLSGTYRIGGPDSMDQNCTADLSLDTRNKANTLTYTNVKCGKIGQKDAINAIKGGSVNPGQSLQPGSNNASSGGELAGGDEHTQATRPFAALEDSAKELVCQLNLGLSWLTCGFTDNILMINNALYKAISSMLEFPKKLVANGDAAHGLWNVFRMAANTVLLAAFIVIIFSQATSIGLSAYGVKKLLPRVMAFAIIINLSFFISQLAIDVSNIAGAGINRTIATMAVNAGGGSQYPAECPDMASFNPTQADSDTAIWQCALNLTRKDQSKEMEDMSKAILPAMVFAGPIIAIIIFVAVVAIIAIFVGFVVLLARQIIIVAMVIFSPIGIACAILPGTKKIYEFWKNTFASMLFMFPIISLLFAGSNLIALMIPQMQFFAGTSLEPVAAYINVLIVIIVLVSPWFAIPFVVKTSGGMLGKLTGALDKFSGAKLARDKMKSAAGEAVKDRAKNVSNVARTRALNSKSSAVRRMAGAGFIARKQARAHNVKELERAKVGAAAKHIDGAKPGRYSPEQVGAAKETQDKLDLENAIRTFTYTMSGDVEEALKQAIENGDYHLANVALESAAEKGDTNTIGLALDKIAAATKSDGSAKFSDSNMKSLANNMLAKGGQRIDDSDMGVSRKVKDLAKGGADTASARATASSSQSFIQSAIAGKSDSELASHKSFGKVAAHIDTSRLEKIMGDERLRSTVKQENVTVVNQEISNRYAPARPPRRPGP